MSQEVTHETGSPLEALGEGIERLRQHWWLFLLLGILLVAGGFVAIGYPLYSSVGAVVVLGVVKN